MPDGEGSEASVCPSSRGRLRAGRPVTGGAPALEREGAVMTEADVRSGQAAGAGGGELAGESELAELYRAFAAEHLSPLWTQTGDLMPPHPRSRAAAHVWRWKALYALAERAGGLVPVGRGGERRAIALANPSLDGRPWATPTLWAAIQYLGPGEVAPEHRHSQHAFRFVLEGEGVWTVVDGDPVAMRRGDLLVTAGWQLHGHHNDSDRPMAWLDGLDVPFAQQVESGFFEAGADGVTDRSTPERSRSERLWGHPGLVPLSRLGPQRSTPLAAYRWHHTDAALAEQLALEDEGRPGVVEPGHAAVRFSNPTTGGDVMATLRAELHRLRPGTTTAPVREVGSACWQVFQGEAVAVLDGREVALSEGDCFVTPSWVALQLHTAVGADLFRFADTPVLEALGLDRREVG